MAGLVLMFIIMNSYESNVLEDDEEPMTLMLKGTYFIENII